MITRTLHGLRNTRDLRAEIASLAAELVGNDSAGRLVIVAPLISADTAREEWQRLTPALEGGVAARMTMTIEPTSADAPGSVHDEANARFAIALQRPNYRYEVLRLLLSASMSRQRPPTIKDLIATIGTSQTPIRQAIAVLKAAGIVIVGSDGLQVRPQEVSQEILAKVGALPQTVRFRFARGAMDKSPANLLQRLTLLSSSPLPLAWNHFGLSGVAVAQKDVPQLDIAGLPRIDLLAHAERKGHRIDASAIAQLDHGLEFETNVLAPAPIVVTLVRASILSARQASDTHLLLAGPGDVFLSLLDTGLRTQALQYAKAVQR